MNTEHLNLESSLPYPKRIPPLKKSRAKRGLKDYEFVIDQNSLLKTSDLGAGALGRVKKVREKATGELYAMKIMNKQNIFRYSSKENLKREVAIQKSQNHPHIIKLYHYFEDKENVYLILELAENGSLFDYIRTKGKFTENEAFVYFFQTALGVNYLHKNNIIHRDLKPENLLLDKNGNIKVCDFGWSAETQSRRATFCGTVDYMAPEMIKNQPYDHRIDIWSLGILLYELIHGYPPFEGKTDQEKSVNISKNKPINFNISLSWEVCDLIRGLLRPLPEDRLTMDEIFRHSWMKKYEKIYQIDLMSYVEEQDLDSKDRDSSNDSKRDSLRDDEDDHRKSGHNSSRNSLEEHDKVRSYYLESLEGRNRGPKSHIVILLDGNLSSTKDSERNSGDLHQYYSINLDGHSRFRSIPPSLTSLGDEERGRTRPKYLSDIDTSMRIPDGMDRGSLAGTENLSALFRKNFELEKKLKAATRPKPSLFKRILMELGCISRDPRKNFE